MCRKQGYPLHFMAEPEEWVIAPDSHQLKQNDLSWVG